VRDDLVGVLVRSRGDDDGFAPAVDATGVGGTHGEDDIAIMNGLDVVFSRRLLGVDDVETVMTVEPRPVLGVVALLVGGVVLLADDERIDRQLGHGDEVRHDRDHGEVEVRALVARDGLLHAGVVRSCRGHCEADEAHHVEEERLPEPRIFHVRSPCWFVLLAERESGDDLGEFRNVEICTIIESNRHHVAILHECQRRGPVGLCRFAITFIHSHVDHDVGDLHLLVFRHSEAVRSLILAFLLPFVEELVDVVLGISVGPELELSRFQFDESVRAILRRVSGQCHQIGLVEPLPAIGQVVADLEIGRDGPLRVGVVGRLGGRAAGQTENDEQGEERGEELVHGFLRGESASVVWVQKRPGVVHK